VAFYLRRSARVDIMLIGEGTYPYVKGGVSSWIHQLIKGLPDKRFGICFIGSNPHDYDDIQYDFPDNLVHVEIHYLFDDSQKPRKKLLHIDKDAFGEIEKLHENFEYQENSLPSLLHSEEFFEKRVTFGHFLHAKKSWEFIRKKYYEKAEDMPFIDYFWSVRNMHQPIWIIAGIVRDFPEIGILHSPSTGYAGLIGTLASYQKSIPFILTEHGIYTRERKIDLLTADWISYHKLTLISESEEMNYIKELWIGFFEKIAGMAYHRAELIFSLYRGAQMVQQAFGAPKEKTRVVPNGVDADGLGTLVEKRSEDTPYVVTLIGRVVSIKDIKTFIRAMRILADRIDGVEGWIVGPEDEDPEYAKECHQMVEALKLSSCVKFLGFQNIREILPKTGLLTLTSISEGMPLVILEGFAAGVPCVATDVGSCRDLIEGGVDEEDVALGKAGSVTQIANPSELAQAYYTFLTNGALWKNAQKTGLKRVNKYYRQETFLQRYEEIYDTLLEKR